ncbi:MAG TPA: AI-2E family transporter [Tepidisphaeraceae bacterium]|jgi:predicted PurR-regulated permease PerM|nr:AI-2E family transporter [Tepidisphaeraceae bacterium]
MKQPRSRPSGGGVAGLVVAGCVLAYLLRYVLLPFVFAGALAFLSRPLMRRLQRNLSFPRWLAALLTFVSFLGMLALAGWGIERLALPELTQLMTDSRATIQKLIEGAFDGRELQLPGKRLTARQLADELNGALEHVGDNPEQIIGFAVLGFGAMMGGVLTCALFGFFLFTGRQVTQGMLWLVPPPYRPLARSLALKVDPVLARYLEGVFIIVLFTTTVTFIVTGLVFHVSHAFFLSLAVGLLELIPVIGPILSFIAFGLVAVQQTSFAMIIWFGVFAIALRLAIDQLVGPVVLGRAAEIPPVVVIFAFLAGGTLYGFLGVLLAIPVAATVKIVLADVYNPSPESPVGRATSKSPPDSEV